MTGTFTIPTPSHTEVEVSFCPLLQKAFDLWESKDYQASLNVLEGAASLVDSVSLELAGKFHNQLGLALVGLKQYERAIEEYQCAIRDFESYGSTSLLSIAKNNLGWVYLQLGQFEQAHEYIDDALLLVERDDLRARFHDTKAQVFLAEGKQETALVENAKALALFAGTEQALADCLASRAKIKQGECLQQDSLGVSMASTQSVPDTPREIKLGGVPMPALDYAREILNNSHEAATALFGIIVAVADPEGDPVRYSLAWEILRLVHGFTPAGEVHLREEIDRASLSVEQSSDLTS